jgi:NADH-quinone oxidoreductase subunit N
MMGAFSTAIFLMGVALFYGLTGDLDFSSLSQISANLSGSNLSIASVAGILIFSGLAFKVALVPFHMWAPDVYQGAPTGIASYLASATKLSVFCALLYAFDVSHLWTVAYVRDFAVFIGVLTIVIGSLLAIAQKQLRRMFAYSSIVNAGYVGLVAILGARSAPSVFIYLFV